MPKNQSNILFYIYEEGIEKATKKKIYFYALIFAVLHCFDSANQE